LEHFIHITFPDHVKYLNIQQIHLPVEGGSVERPLAKRRQLIESLSEKAENEDQTTPVASPMKESTGGDDTPFKGADDGELTPASKGDSAKEVNIDDPEVESIAQLEEKLNDDKAADSAAKKKTILKALSPKKSLKEIEEEVARNTAKYDEDTMNGDPIAKKKPTSKEMSAASQKTKNANIAAANINPTNVTRLIRMFVIIALGTYKGKYQICGFSSPITNCINLTTVNYRLIFIRLLHGAEQHRGQPCCTDTKRIGKHPSSFCFSNVSPISVHCVHFI